MKTKINLSDLIGKRYGRLIIESTEIRKSSKRNRIYCLCKCDCGNSHESIYENLESGDCRSCGCYYQETRTTTSLIHGQSYSSEYTIWKQMKARCSNKNKNYGGRGIIVCERWLNSFENFLADMGSRPSRNHSIERIDNDKNYEPLNCKWATRIVQMRNTRRNINIEYNGKTQCLQDWCNELGISRNTMNKRLWTLKWSVKKSFTQSIR